MFENYELVKTMFGIIGYSWSAKGLSFVQLPEKDTYQTKNRLLQKIGITKSCPPPFDKNVLNQMFQEYSKGIKIDFNEIPLDLNITDFQNKVYKKLRQLPYGDLITYKELAINIHSPNAARAIGMAMSRNPAPIIIPCHRVIPSSKKSLGGFTAFGGEKVKEKFLKLENSLKKLNL